MPVTRDEVLWAYKLIMGRSPESESVIKHHMQSQDLDALRASFMNSIEFRSSLHKVINSMITVMPLDAEKIEVEVNASSAQIAACIEKIKKSWTHLGNTRPHWSVLTSERFLPENIDASMEEFWESGERTAEQLESILARYDCNSIRTKTCVEFGCGVGRITIPLARRFAMLHGYDISAAHLSLALKRAQEQGIDNMALHVWPETLLGPLAECDVFYSIIVFQHNPPPVISKLLSDALRALKPAGIAIFQVPTYIKGYYFNTREWLNDNHPLEMQMHCLPQRNIFEIVVRENCELLDVREDNKTGKPDRFISNTFIIRKKVSPSSYQMLNQCVNGSGLIK